MVANFYFSKFNFREDLEALFAIMLDNRDQILSNQRIQINSIPNFEQWLMNNMSSFYHDFYLIKNVADHSIIGYVYSYDYRIYDGHCKVCLVLSPNHRDSGIGAFVGIKFLDQIFTNYPLRKIYIDIYDYNQQSLNCNLGIGFIEEGCLKNYRYDKGTYFDLHLLSITREVFYKNAERFIKS